MAEVNSICCLGVEVCYHGTITCCNYTVGLTAGEAPAGGAASSWWQVLAPRLGGGIGAGAPCTYDWAPHLGELVLCPRTCPPGHPILLGRGSYAWLKIITENVLRIRNQRGWDHHQYRKPVDSTSQCWSPYQNQTKPVMNVAEHVNLLLSNTCYVWSC